MNHDINLLERRKARIALIRFSKFRLLHTIAVSLLFFVSCVSIIIFILISISPLPQLKIQEQQLVSSLSQMHPDMMKISLVNERADAIESILSNRKSYDTTLEIIQNKLPAGVDVESLSMEKNTISLSVSSGSLSLLDSFLNNLLKSVQEKTDFSKVTLTSLSIDNQSRLFLLTVSLVTL